jgi:tetratricopeptide (TPR) repeat protein
MDFGLAKSEQGNAEQPTVTGAALGTPSYMSPEQAAGKSKEAGPATDIYALGAILYELLAGRPPFRGESAVDTLLQVQSDEPVPPRRLRPKMPRDLETICLKCLQKNPAKRYASAGDLAADLRRFLAREPIQARPVSWPERGWRWCRRRPLVAGLSAALVLVAVGGFAGVTALWRVAAARAADLARESEKVQRERNTALKEQARAEANYDKARAAVDQLEKVGRQMLDQPRTDKAGRAVLEEVLTYRQGFLLEKSSDPGVRRDAAKACMSAGSVLIALGQPEKAEEPYRQAVDLFARLVEEFPDEEEDRHRLADSYNQLGQLLRRFLRYSEADQAHGHAIAILEELLPAARDSLRCHGHLANVLTNWGVVLERDGRPEQAERAYRRALELQEKVAEVRPTDANNQREWAMTRDGLGFLLWHQSRPGEAEAACREARDELQKLAKAYPAASAHRDLLARAWFHLGVIWAGTERMEEAKQAHREAIAILNKLQSDSPAVVEHRLRLAGNYLALARLQRREGKSAEADKSFAQAIAIYNKLIRELPKASASGYWNLARLHRDEGRHAAAIDCYRRALAAHPDHANSANSLAWILATCPDAALRDPAEALTWAKKAVQLRPEDPAFWNTLGVVQYRLGDYPAAISSLEKTIATRTRGDAYDWVFLAMAHGQRGERKQAERYYVQAVQWMQKHQPQSEELRSFRAEAEALLREGSASVSPSAPESP